MKTAHCIICGEQVDDIKTHMQDEHSPEDFAEAVQAYQPDIEPQLTISRSPTFQKTYSTNFLVNFSEFDLRIQVTNEKFNHHGPNPMTEIISEAMIISTPVGAKNLVNKLEEAIDQFEELFGEIPVDDGVRREMK